MGAPRLVYSAAKLVPLTMLDVLRGRYGMQPIARA